MGPGVAGELVGDLFAKIRFCFSDNSSQRCLILTAFRTTCRCTEEKFIFILFGKKHFFKIYITPRLVGGSSTFRQHANHYCFLAMFQFSNKRQETINIGFQAIPKLLSTVTKQPLFETVRHLALYIYIILYRILF